MKRILYICMLSIVFLFLIACSKDEVSPHGDVKEAQEAVEQQENEKRSLSSVADDEQHNEEKDQETVNKDTDQKHTDNNTESRNKGNSDDKSKSQPEVKEGKPSENSATSNPKEGNTSSKQKNEPSSSAKPNGNSTKQADSDSKQTSSQPSKPKPKPEPAEKPKPEETKKTITVSVDTRDVKGMILPPTKVSYQKGDTALDPTLRVLKQRGIQISVRGSGATAYVEGIDNLYEFDEGPLSGWMITVDGVLIDRSAGIYPIHENSIIKWVYTTDYINNPAGG